MTKSKKAPSAAQLKKAGVKVRAGIRAGQANEPRRK
jgi:hypothetical protein